MLKSRTEAMKAQAVAKLSEKSEEIAATLARVESKLDELLARDVPGPTATAKKKAEAN